MLNLSNSPKFLKDYNNLQEQIRKVEDIDTKSYLNGLLRELRLEVQKLDVHHSELSPTVKLGQKTHDARDSIQSIRKKIIKSLRDYKEAH